MEQHPLHIMSFCPACGTKGFAVCNLKTPVGTIDRIAKKCPTCGFVHYHDVAPAVSAIIINEKKQFLCIRKDDKLHPISGFILPGESPIQALARILKKKTGLTAKTARFLIETTNDFAYGDIVKPVKTLHYVVQGCNLDFLEARDEERLAWRNFDKVSEDAFIDTNMMCIWNAYHSPQQEILYRQQKIADELQKLNAVTTKQPRDSWKFCPKCGSMHFENFKSAGKLCADCGFIFHTNPKLAVVTLLKHPHKGVLLGERKFAPGQGKTNHIGGFVNYWESIPQAAYRQCKDETNMDIEQLTYFGDYVNIFEDNGHTQVRIDRVFEAEVDLDDWNYAIADSDIAALFIVPPSKLQLKNMFYSSTQQIYKDWLEL